MLRPSELKSALGMGSADDLVPALFALNSAAFNLVYESKVFLRRGFHR